MEVNFFEELQGWFITFIYKLTSAKLWAWAFVSVMVPIGIIWLETQVVDKDFSHKMSYLLIDLWKWVTGIFIGAAAVQSTIISVFKKDQIITKE